MSALKIVFLDIDGVLNYSEFWKKEHQHLRYKRLPEGAPDGAHDICLDKVKLLNQFTKETGCKYVISSSWRLGRTVEQLREVLQYCGFEGEIIDKTMYLSFDSKDYHKSVPRGCEIKAWLEMNKDLLGVKFNKARYVIFDDDSDMLYWQREHYFLVDGSTGITENVLYRAKMFLNKFD